MRNRNLKLALLAGVLALTSTNLLALRGQEASPAPNQAQLAREAKDFKNKDTQPAVTSAEASNLRASSLIGLPVRGDSGERLGKLQDIIVNLESHAAPFAIVEYGSTFGIGGTRVAVPLADLKWSMSEPRQLFMTTTKADFQAANLAPTGEWAAVAGEDWAKSVDRYYGQPSMADSLRHERHEATGMMEGREPVRHPTKGTDPADKLAPLPANSPTEQIQPPAAPPADQTPPPAARPGQDDLTTKVNSLVKEDAGKDADNIQVSIKDGVVTLTGKVATAAQKAAIESRIKALSGVERVENNLETAQQ